MIGLLTDAIGFIGKHGALMNYIHVDNVAEALLRCGCMDAAKNKVYNLSDQRTVEEFVAIIADSLGKPMPFLRLPEAPIRFISKILGNLPGFPRNRE